MTIQDVLGINMLHGYILQIFLAEILFVSVLKRRNYFILRLVCGVAVFALLSIVITNLIQYIGLMGIISITMFLLSLVLCVFCFKNSFKDILFCCVGAQLIQNLAHNVENLIYLPLSDYINDIGWFFLSAGVMATVYIAFYFIAIRKLEKQNKINLGGMGVFTIAIFSALFCYLIQTLLQIYGLDVHWVNRLPLILCDVIALIVQFGLLGYMRKIDENAELEKFIVQDNKYYESMKNNIDVINMKAHDLKHFIADLRVGSSIDDQELAEIQSAVEQYEQTANTGNKALDAVLTEKTYLCHKKNIAFTTIAQGAELAFMHMCDITSLFGNILSNAIEHEEIVEDKNKRCILLRVLRKGGLISIHAENYCNSEIVFKDNLPVTTKGDTDYHGFGLKSVRYVAQKYGGNVTVGKEGELFTVDIIIPVPTEDKK